MAGNLNGTSVIWVVGEATGKNESGASVAIPSNDRGAIVISGGVPTGAPSGLPLQVNTLTRVMSAWTGSAWVTVSGA